MAGLKELRNRLESIRSTQKITSAMKMVAASRLRRAQTTLEKNRLYADGLQLILRRTLAVLHDEEKRKKISYVLPELLRSKLNAKHFLLFVLSSDRGLCGSYNQNIGKAAVRRITALEESGASVKIICYGKKAYDFLKKKYADRIAEHYPALASKNLSSTEAEDLTKKIESAVQNDGIDVCEILYSRFRSAVSREIKAQQVWPLETAPAESDEDTRRLICLDQAYYDIKPDPLTVLNYLLPQVVVGTVFSAILNAQASEQGARMAAMDNATRNAKEMIGTLTLKYNSIRQSAITTELTEIISGAEAV
jgi:F-type H+-transporting ATPase subunit gamma